MEKLVNYYDTMGVLSGAEGRSDYCPSCLTSLGRKQMGSWRDEIAGPNPHPGTQPSLCCVAVGLDSTTDTMNPWLDNNMKHNLPNLLDGFSVPVQLFPVSWFFTRQNLCLQLNYFVFVNSATWFSLHQLLQRRECSYILMYDENLVYFSMIPNIVSQPTHRRITITTGKSRISQTADDWPAKERAAPDYFWVNFSHSCMKMKSQLEKREEDPLWPPKSTIDYSRFCDSI